MRIVIQDELEIELQSDLELRYVIKSKVCDLVFCLFFLIRTKLLSV